MWLVGGIQNNHFEFYVRAVDRAHTRNAIKWYADLFSDGCDDEDYYEIGNFTWQNLQSEVANFISNHGGLVTIKYPEYVRINFSLLNSKLKSSVLVNFVTCE